MKLSEDDRTRGRRCRTRRFAVFVNFGDAGVNLQLRVRPFELVLHAVLWISFSTDCAQNVIAAIRITENLNEVDVPKQVGEELFRRTFRSPGDTDRSWQIS
jgi:hypothetical protein